MTMETHSANSNAAAAGPDGQRLQVARALQAYYDAHLPHLAAHVIEVVPLGTGISRETFRINLAGAEDIFHVAQIEPAHSLVPGDSGRVEYEICKALEGTLVPVATMLARVDDRQWFNAPFSLAVGLPGSENDPADMRARFPAEAPSIVVDSFAVLGRIAALDLSELAIDGLPGAGGGPVWRLQLDYWRDQIRANPIGPRPVLDTAIRWLVRNPPPLCAKPGLVHGDYRIGNYLFERTGLCGVVDWEMAHVGDPLEDLAWAILQNWRFHGSPDLVAGCLTPDDAISAWEAAAGVRADRRALAWWTVFSHVKAMALWCSAIHKLDTGATASLRYANVALITMPRQEGWLMADWETFQ